MMIWIMIWALISFPFMFWEGSPAQYELIQQFGRDPVTIFVILLVLVPFVGTIINESRG